MGVPPVIIHFRLAFSIINHHLEPVNVWGCLGTSSRFFLFADVCEVGEEFLNSQRRRKLCVKGLNLLELKGLTMLVTDQRHGWRMTHRGYTYDIINIIYVYIIYIVIIMPCVMEDAKSVGDGCWWEWIWTTFADLMAAPCARSSVTRQRELSSISSLERFLGQRFHHISSYRLIDHPHGQKLWVKWHEITAFLHVWKADVPLMILMSQGSEQLYRVAGESPVDERAFWKQSQLGCAWLQSTCVIPRILWPTFCMSCFSSRFLGLQRLI